jgi:hypothetical protein
MGKSLTSTLIISGDWTTNKCSLIAMEIGVIMIGMNGFATYSLYFVFYSSGTTPFMFYGRGLGCFLYLPPFIMVDRLPQDLYIHWRNESDGRNRNWGPAYRPFNLISGWSYFWYPLRDDCYSCSNIRFQNEARERKKAYRNSEEFVESCLTGNVRSSGLYR